jgi:hypothetical protein
VVIISTTRTRYCGFECPQGREGLSIHTLFVFIAIVCIGCNLIKALLVPLSQNVFFIFKKLQISFLSSCFFPAKRTPRLTTPCSNYYVNASPQLAAYKKAASLAFAGCVSFEQLMDSMTEGRTQKILC